MGGGGGGGRRGGVGCTYDHRMVWERLTYTTDLSLKHNEDNENCSAGKGKLRFRIVRFSYDLENSQTKQKQQTN